MPYDDPEPDDPHELVGVELPGDRQSLRAMAEAFAEEFAALGFPEGRIRALFREPFYAGAHRALAALGEPEIDRIVSESVAVWGRLRVSVRDVRDGKEFPCRR